MKQRIVPGLLALAAIAVTAAPGLAENRSGAGYISPFVGGYTFDGAQHLKTRPTFGLRGGYNLDKNWAAELLFGYVPTKQSRGQGNDVDAYRYGLDVLYNFMPDSALVPFLAVGGGASTIDHPEGVSDEHEQYVNYGGGLKYFVTDSFAFRGDVRHIYMLGPENHNFEYTLGLSYFFGGERPAPAKVAALPEPPKAVEPPPPAPAPKKEMVPPPPPPAPKDTDGDGVIDELDKCPDTPAGVKVDSVGCPLDTDKDGVYDYLDKCPDTPAGVKVDSVGCPLDTDGDGVYDYLDKCPDTPRDLAVDAKGCPERVCITLGVQFDTDKAVVKPQYHDEIKKAADFLKEYPEATAVIEGHTDSVGSDAYNQKLSERRAKAVMKYLVDKLGINAKRLSAKGFGESKPIADNATEEGRYKNRRVVATIDCGMKKRR